MSVNLEDNQPKPGVPAWVVTFGDMMSLLLCFFVLLLSFSTMESERFKVIAGYIRQAFGVQIEQQYTEIPAGDTVVSVEFNPPSYKIESVFERVLDLMRTHRLDRVVEADLEDLGVRIRMDGSLMFAPASATIESDFLQFLDGIAAIIEETGMTAVVEGHSDNMPISSPVFPSNWELSAARAASVVRYLESCGLPGHRLTAVGHADTRPIAENTTPEGRQRNRRVEILLETPPEEEVGL
ncbi:MAG: OmpA family protein [Acidobacteriota bacterium]|nr:MAG: OmpA family protein [Acidobacteriota bacterium]